MRVAYLGTTWTDPCSPRPAHARSPLGDQWHHSRWAAVSASAPGTLRYAGGGRRASRVLLRKISGKMLLIWDGSPTHRGHEVKDFRQQRCRQALAYGTTAGLCARPRSRWGHMDRGRACRARQCLLSRLGLPASGASSGQGALATRKRDHSELRAPLWLFALVPSHEVSKNRHPVIYS